MSASLQRHGAGVRVFGKAMAFGVWLTGLPARLVPPPVRLIQMGSAFWQSRALYVAARLDMAGVLGEGMLEASQIARQVGADADAIGRLLRMLVSAGVFDVDAEGRFRNNRVSACLRGDHPQSVRAMVLMHNAAPMCRPWFEQLEGGVREGTAPFRRVHGEDLFAYLDRDPAFDRLFSEAMDCVEALSGDAFATDFDWRRFGRIIDVGGSRGAKSLAILRRHPGLSALVVDRAQVIAEAQRHWAAHPVPDCDRLSFAEGDLFGTLPVAEGETDIYFLSALLHCFDDAACVTGLRYLGRVCGKARIAVLEMVLPESGVDAAGSAFDLQMFMAGGGRERRLSDWRRVVGQSGLVLEEVVGLRSFAKILVLRSASA
ncbi:methyltransferase [Zoogloea sp. LCSB751]|uniref:methyltransferase n=1 Tax=Zoogloea sp. LCSB751 TaxID=1965277 RepID=UPI0009A51C24|nr:methyltransferase [Zoogloea sp. LCSB751]